MSLPIISGHRGSKGTYTENTIEGFKRCFQTGATVETDLYLTTDNVCVISHDVTTKRSYNLPNGEESNYVVPQTAYKDLKQLVNKETGTLFVSFKEVLDLFVEADESSDVHLSIMLDIKPSNRPVIMKFIIKELLDKKPDINYWLDHIYFGIWIIDFIIYMNQDDYFQQLYDNYDIKGEFNIVNIVRNSYNATNNIIYNHYIDENQTQPHVFKFKGVSILYLSMYSQEFITTFLPFVKAEGLLVFAWTVNTTLQYDYFINVCKIAKIETYGIISDFPEKMQAYKTSGKHTIPNGLQWTQIVSKLIFKAASVIEKSPIPEYTTKVDPEHLEIIILNYIVGLMFWACQYIES